MHLASLIAQLVLASAEQTGPDAALRCRALLERAATGHALRAALQRELAQAGLTESGFAVMGALRAREPRPVLRSDLGVLAELSPMRATDALTRLEMSGLVQRHRDEADRRLVWLRLTPEGHARIVEALRRYVAAAGSVTESLGAPELETSIEISRQLGAGAARLTRESAAQHSVA